MSINVIACLQNQADADIEDSTTKLRIFGIAFWYGQGTFLTAPRSAIASNGVAVATQGAHLPNSQSSSVNPLPLPKTVLFDTFARSKVVHRRLFYGMLCPSCDKDIEGTAAFCRHCGGRSSPDSRSYSSDSVRDNQRSRLDRVVFAGFRLGRLIGVVLTVVFFVVFLVAGTMLLLSGRSSLKTPKFSDRSNTNQSETGKIATDTSAIKDRQNVERKYGDRLRKVIENYSIAANGYGILVGWTLEVPEKDRDAFVSGMEDFMADGVASAKKKNRPPDGPSLVDEYHRLFSEALTAEAQAKLEGQQTRLQTLAVLGGSALLFFVFLTIPALLQIERNTRLRDC
jgi:hypothetical protein